MESIREATAKFTEKAQAVAMLEALNSNVFRQHRQLVAEAEKARAALEDAVREREYDCKTVVARNRYIEVAATPRFPRSFDAATLVKLQPELATSEVLGNLDAPHRDHVLELVGLGTISRETASEAIREGVPTTTVAIESRCGFRGLMLAPKTSGKLWVPAPKVMVEK